MNKKRKNSFLFVVLLSILSLCLFDSHMVKAESVSEHVTEIDYDGNLLKGTELNTDRPIIRPVYQGNAVTMLKDVSGPKGYFTGFYDQTTHIDTSKHRQQYSKGETLLIKNLGQYNGRGIALKITFLLSDTIGLEGWRNTLRSYILKDGAVCVDLGLGSEDVPIQYQLVYDEPGNQVVQNIYLELPTELTIGGTNGLRYPAINIGFSNLKKAFIAMPNVQKSYSLVSKTVDTKNVVFFNGEFNILTNAYAKRKVSIVSNNNEPTVLILKSVMAIMPTVSLFKSEMKVPYLPTYLPIRANGEGNSDKLEAKYDIGQTVVDAYPNYLPESLKIVAEDTEGYFTNLTPQAVNFTDKDGKEIADLISVGEASNGKLEMTLSKESLEKLKSNQVNIKLSFDEFDLEKLLNNYNATEKLYKVPLTFYNVRNEEGKEVESEKVTVEASISPNIYGEAKPKKVSLGSSSSELKAMDLIKNGVTTIPNDTLKLSIIGSHFFDEFKTYTVNVKIESTKIPSLTKTVPVSIQVEEPLEEGWEIGTSSDFILDAGYKIEWMEGAGGYRTIWWYTYQNKSWIYTKAIDAALLVNGVFPTATSDTPKEGFLWANGAKSEYSINRQTKSLKRTFLYLTKYKIEIIQQMLGNHAIEVTYRVTNLNDEVQKIGTSQYVDVFVGSDYVPVTPINNFIGINLTYPLTDDSFVIIPDQQTMPNWAAGYFAYTKKMQQYDQVNANGVGWETGKRYRASNGSLFSPPVELQENQSVNLTDSAISMKNGGVSVMPKESVLFKQILKFGNLAPPKITLDQTSGTLYNEDTIEITGTISDEDNLNYRLYLEMDNPAKTLIPLKEFSNVPYNQVQSYRATIKGEDFTPGKHDTSIIGIDEYGMRSLPRKIRIVITELKGTPFIQKVGLGEQIPQTDLRTLIKDLKGKDVKLKENVVIDSSKIGFQWIDIVLIDSNLRELPIKLPVNVYNPESTMIDDEKGIALDAPNVNFDSATVSQAEKDKQLDELVNQKVNPVAWDITDGSQVNVSLIKNGVQPVFGTYTAIFEADNGEKLQKEIQISVGGELKFKELPSDLAFKKSKLGWGDKFIQRSQTDWKIEIENTIGSNWFLKASASPFENQTKEQLKHGLIFKNKENQVKEINSDVQVIAMDAGEIYPVIQWEKTGGLLVKLNPAAKIGMYQGEITWELTDAP